MPSKYHNFDVKSDESSINAQATAAVSKVTMIATRADFKYMTSNTLQAFWHIYKKQEELVLNKIQILSPISCKLPLSRGSQNWIPDKLVHVCSSGLRSTSIGSPVNQMKAICFIMIGEHLCK